MEPRLFNLDPQLLHDAVLLAIADIRNVFISFLHAVQSGTRNAEKASGQGEE